uniref:PDZ domain-containing protein 8 n=1 Tax=Lutzomyia longipalpis TaxID=7200 RepID=A0A1B0GJQ9_LUTLO
MDVVDILLFCFISCVIGAVLMLLGQYYVFVRFIETPNETEESTSITQKFELPDSVLSSIKSSESESKNPIVAINLVLQFLFYELRHSNRVRKWFYRKLSLELDELLTKSTTGRLFDKLTIRELELGGQFPDIKSLRVNNVELHDAEGYIENLDVMLDLSYRGNFRLSIDADMVLGKKGFLSVRVKHIAGLARLQFTRKPYTHWSLSFVGDPQVDLGIESQFQGRQMQSNVTSFISNQIRKAIRSKHTLPSYKLRYKPFFQKIDDDLDASDTIPEGTLTVNICEVSRLNVPTQITSIFCSLTLASMPWAEARQQDERTIILSLDVEIHKAKNQQIGISFKQIENAVMIDAIIPNTPAAKANLKKRDILISIEGKKVNHLTHVSKILKGINRPMFLLRIQRSAQGVIKNDAVQEEFEIIESIDDGNISFSKASDSVQIGTKITRMNSLERNSSDSSVSNTPTNTPRKSGSSGNPLLRSKSRSVSVENEPKSPSKIPNPEIFQQQTTTECPFNSFMRMEQVCTFNLKENLVYLNLNVFGQTKDETIFLGYHNIFVPSILSECNESTMGHYLKRFNLTAPEAPNLVTHPLSSQSGFESRLCYGDVLISFAWSDFSASPASTSQPTDAKRGKYSGSRTGSTDKLEEDRSESQKQHNFIRTHFNRATQCDFCGKKIWLKDAAQCKECSMCCHKKCITKCQNSTVCGPVDAQVPISSPQQTVQPEFRVTNHGFLSVRVKHIAGLARLQFTRKPYTHWSLSFVGDPQVDLGIESQFQGRQMQSNVTSFISNQIRKAIRSKHTLPSYKLRYKPFFQKIDDDLDTSDTIPEGTLTVNICEQIENAVMIDAIIPNTPAAKANLKKRDILISIEGKKVNHLTHVSKILKVQEEFEIIESIDDGNISFSKASDSVQIGTKITRMNSLERNSSDSSVSNTPTNTPRKSGSSGNPLLRSKSRSVSVENEPKSPSKIPNPEIFQQQTTTECPFNSFMRMEQTKDETIFLGYHNIFVPSILSECNESTMGHYLKRFNLTAPEAPNLVTHPLSSQSGFESRLCYGDVLISFAWSDFNASPAGTSQPTDTKRGKYSGSRTGSTDKLEEDRSESQKQHNFIRTHFNRATQCDFCGKKIWLKDAAQCKECSMCCHKKCITKCQNSTVCGPVDAQVPISSPQQTVQPEFRVTQPCEEVNEGDDPEEINRLKSDGHRQSFSDLLTQGLKRVNSANNLAIPAIVSSLGQGSRSLPPSPQYTPRKQSLVQATNPLAQAIHRLEAASLTDIPGKQMSEKIDGIVEPFSGTPLDEIMTLAKTSSLQLYTELEPAKRVDKINEVLAKLRLALDMETTTHADLSMASAELRTAKLSKVESPRVSSDANHGGKGSDARKAASREKEAEAEMARIAFLLGQSEERVQALSVIMLHLCSALQHAQSIASP